MKNTWIFATAVAVSSLSLVTSSSAAVVAYYPLGEAGSMSSNKPQDTSGNNHNFSAEQGTVGSSSALAAPGTGSTASFNFPGGGAGTYGITTPIPNIYGDFSVSLWAYPTDATQPDGAFLYGTNGGSTGSLVLNVYNPTGTAPQWAASYAGQTWIGGIAGAGQLATLNAWNHLEIQRVDGVSTFLINGAPQGSTSGFVPSNFNSPHLAVSPGGSPTFIGNLDEFQINVGGAFHDGGFESGLGPWSEVGSNTGVSVHTGNYCCGLTGAAEGNSFLVLSGGLDALSTAVQHFDTVPGQTYNLSFQYNQAGGGSAGLLATVSDFNSQFNFSNQTGPSLFNSGTIALTDNDWHLFTGSFTATGTSSLIAFTHLQFNGSSDAAIDAVVITAVPEPSSLAMLLFGSVVMFLFRKRNG